MEVVDIASSTLQFNIKEEACSGGSAPHSFALNIRTRNNQNFTYMENFQLLISLSEDILVLFSNDDNYMRNLDDVWETLSRSKIQTFSEMYNSGF